ncbi:glycosyltransferase family 9 protein [Marinoscillum furvescens]|uniref:Heptosyltransferase-2 n=1 Tax=Marinoscillum furvescens DSM 4134 TaxID=1122208 RepID=A0A3D9LH30_MARFU|nr:glycosyltransferase family 9 protein [Marinoscillum furvescens]REE05794.1 heptosyltransferase-2 [Marinoscillum furvescens DSM 4134]
MQILIIQTAYIGDVVLATSLIEKIKVYHPDAQIDFLLRKGNEEVLAHNPKVREVLMWNKQQRKWRGLMNILRLVRSRKYDLVVNVHRYLSSGLIAALSGAGYVVGFRQNPLSYLFDERVTHLMDGRHEIARNQELIASITDAEPHHPKMYVADVSEKVTHLKSKPYVTVSPGSVWPTKQVPVEKWVELLDRLPGAWKVYLLGAKSDEELCVEILKRTSHKYVTSQAGLLSMRASAALMQDAEMNYVNDSAPMHFASAVGAPVCAVFCSTSPGLGFGPLSDRHFVVEVKGLTCKPCGISGKKACPLGHFRCGNDLEVNNMLDCLP